jgi:tetratricopeptide (TPR) repeat protein
LLEQVWPDTYVDDSAVKRNIMAVRRAIGDGSGSAQHIKTQRGQGYRFTAAVQMHDTQVDIPAHSDAGSERPAQAAITHGDTSDLKPCTICQHENLITARFCVSCGQALDLTCGHCGQAAVPPAAFCPACGQTVSPHSAQPSPQTLTAPDAPVGERKLITALCGTVAHASLHVTGVELDALHSLMQTVYALALDEAQRYGGTMQYTTGEGFLVVFGVPLAQEDHARRAVLTALGLQRRVRQAEPAICLPSGEALLLRMALHSGLVVVGQLQRHAAERPHQTDSALQPLSPLHSRQVMQAVLGSGSLTETMGSQLLAKAEGNPLFLEELARTVAEQGGSQPALAVPDTIHAVLTERIDRLAPAEKQMLQAAAVVGQQVSVSLLHTICGLPHSELQRLLMQLQAGEFLYATQLVPESVYTFKHALTHEVTYANLLREQRRRLHARIVEALAAQGDAVHLDDQLEVLAYHALGAEQWDKVCAYFRQAGAKAMTRSAYREAAACFEQALYGLSHLPGSHQVSEQAVDLRLSLHVALFRLGDVTRSLALLREAEPIAESLDDAGRLGWIVSYLSTHCFMAGDAENALAFSQRAQALAMACADTALQVDVHLHLGQVYHARGEYAAAIAALEPNIAFLNEAWQQDQVDLATLPGPHSVPWLMMCLAETGAFAQGYSYAEEALRVAAIGERPYEQVAVYGSIGVLALRQGDLSRAIPELERAVALCQTAGIPHLLPMGMAHLGAAYTLSGRLPEAISLLQQAIAQGAAMGIRVCQALAHIYLGRAYLQADQPQEAREHMRIALDLCEAHHEQGHQAWALHLLGDLTARDQADAIEAAEDIYRQAITQAEARGMRPLLAHCYFSLANLYRQHGQPTQAEAERSTARALYQSMEMAFWLSRTDSALV